MEESSKEITIDVRNLYQIALRFWYVIIICVVAGVAGGVISNKYITKPKYWVTTNLFTSFKQTQELKSNYISNELNANYKLINDYNELLKSQKVKGVAIEILVANKFKTQEEIDAELERQRNNGVEEPTLSLIPDEEFIFKGEKLSPKKRAELYFFQSEISSSGGRERRFLYVTVEHVDPRVTLLLSEAIIPAFTTVAKEVIGNEMEITVIDPPIYPIDSKPSMGICIIIGLFLSLLICAGIFLLLDILDDKLRSLKELESMAERKIASSINYISNPSSLVKDIYQEKHSPFREAICLLRENLISSISHDNTAKIIMISSINQSDGKSLISCGLWESFAEIGKKAIIIDLDFRRPTLHKKLNVKNEVGLINYVTGNVPIEDIIKTSDTKNHDYILSGGIPLYSIELLKSEKLANCIEQLKTRYDYIILDVPPCIGIVDPIIISRFSDVFMLAVDASTAKKKDIARALDLLKHNNVEMHAIVVNHTKPSHNHGSKQYYYYNYNNK